MYANQLKINRFLHKFCINSLYDDIFLASCFKHEGGIRLYKSEWFFIRHFYSLLALDVKKYQIWCPNVLIIFRRYKVWFLFVQMQKCDKRVKPGPFYVIFDFEKTIDQVNGYYLPEIDKLS